MPRADQYPAKTDLQRTILSFYTLLMQKEFDRWGELFTEDAVQENPFMPALPGLDPKFFGRERIVFHYRTVLSGRRGHVFTVDNIYETADGVNVIVEVAGQSEVPETGRIYDQRYVMIFTMQGNRIAKVTEYFNPLVFQHAFEGFLIGEGAVAN